MTYFQTLTYLLRDQPDFALYVGPEELTGECVLMGADGGVNGVANTFPELYVAKYNALQRLDLEEVRRLLQQIMAIRTRLYSVATY